MIIKSISSFFTSFICLLSPIMIFALVSIFIFNLNTLLFNKMFKGFIYVLIRASERSERIRSLQSDSGANLGGVQRHESKSRFNFLYSLISFLLPFLALQSTARENLEKFIYGLRYTTIYGTL